MRTTTNTNVVSADEFLRAKEKKIQGKLVNHFNLTGNDFRGSVVIEQDYREYHVKVIFNLNGNVIIVKDTYSVYDGIAFERLVAKVAEELAINIVIDSFKNAIEHNPKIKSYLKKETR